MAVCGSPDPEGSGSQLCPCAMAKWASTSQPFPDWSVIVMT